ncbi:MAG: hypothetical protein H6719_24685 [Sandaracinaceae bacterium]|nr:hypothetical protein [Sandaracinaceae bacterium]
MDSKKLACVLAISGMMVGCGGETPSENTFTFPARDENCAAGAAPPCMTDTPANTDAARTIELPEGFADRTLTYVIGTVALPEATPDPDGDGPQRSQAAGFNVDGLDSGNGSTDIEANCEEFNQDFISVTDSSHVGVDNALQGLVGTIEGLLDAADCPGMMTAGCLDATLQRQILEGSLILMVEVSGVNDFMYDSNVMVQMHLGEVPGGGMPTEGSGGGLAGGQTFTSTMTLGAPVQGDIFAGRLRVATPSLPLSIMAGDFNLTLMITQAQVRFNITETAMTNGSIGGVVTVDAIVEAASAIMPGIEDTVRTVVESVADVTPSSADPAVCDAVSLGLTFSGVDATF